MGKEKVGGRGNSDSGRSGNGRKRRGGGSSGREGRGGGGRSNGSNDGNTFLWKSKPERASKSQPARSGIFRNVSYISKLKSGEKVLGNIRDAQQFFRLLSKNMTRVQCWR